MLLEVVVAAFDLHRLPAQCGKIVQVTQSKKQILVSVAFKVVAKSISKLLSSLCKK